MLGKKESESDGELRRKHGFCIRGNISAGPHAPSTPGPLIRHKVYRMPSVAGTNTGLLRLWQQAKKRHPRGGGGHKSPQKRGICTSERQALRRRRGHGPLPLLPVTSSSSLKNSREAGPSTDEHRTEFCCSCAWFLAQALFVKQSTAALPMPSVPGFFEWMSAKNLGTFLLKMAG